MTDEFTLRRAQKGDSSAFEMLVTPHEQMLWRVCWHYTHHQEDAADCLQETMLKAWRGIKSYRGECSLSTWLYRIASTVCLDFLRKQKRLPETESADELAEDEGFLRVLLHEMSHSTMVPLARDPGGPFGSPGYAREELVAELGSMFAAADAGFDCAAMAAADPGEGYYGAHVGYLKSWMSALREDPGELFRAASKASAAADYLVGRLDGNHAAGAA